MENSLLDEDEHYHTQCGKMFATTKGRLIYHCTLCDDKIFNSFDLFEIHLKEHITMLLHVVEMDEVNVPQYDKNLQNYLDESNTNESETQVTSSQKQDKNAINFNQLELMTTDEKVIMQPDIKTEQYLISTPDASVTDASKPKVLHNGIQIPEKVRKVQKRVFPRSALTPAEQRKHKCPVCETAFKEKHNMIHHLKRHTDSRDYKCLECAKRFFANTDLLNHMKTHKNERPFLCNFCGNSYASKYKMREHMKRHTIQKKCKCEICEKTFYNKERLHCHMAIHSSDRPFSCAICAATFKRSKALTNHMKLHANKREYKCELCDSDFNQRAGLYSHMKSVHKIA